MIVSWTEGIASTLYLLVEPKHGFTRKLLLFADEHQYERDQDFDSIPELHGNFHLAWFSGPHGSGAPVSEYGSVLMLATGIGIAAQLPYLQELIQGLNRCEVRTRRVHLA